MKIIDVLQENHSNQIKRLVNEPFLITNLDSVDPSIWANNQVKKSVIKYLLEGIQSDNDDGYQKISCIHLFDELKKKKCPWPELTVLETHIKQILDAEPASNLYSYIESVLNEKPWPLAETRIISDPEWAYYYARYILKRPWPEAESSIIKNNEYAFQYARTVRGRWPEAEPSIMKSRFAYIYARYVLHSAWPEAEPYILKSIDSQEYKDFVNSL